MYADKTVQGLLKQTQKPVRKRFFEIQSNYWSEENDPF